MMMQRDANKGHGEVELNERPSPLADGVRNE